MRLSQRYIEVIKKYFKEFFQNGEIYLFGSRVDDSKKGGDIDLYLNLLSRIGWAKNWCSIQYW